jgi:hypothetical protein
MLGFSVGQTMQSTKERIKNHIFINRRSPIVVAKTTWIAFWAYLSSGNCYLRMSLSMPEAKLKFLDATEKDVCEVP